MYKNIYPKTHIFFYSPNANNVKEQVQAEKCTEEEVDYYSDSDEVDDKWFDDFFDDDDDDN
jgi:hypothetical protein